ncbi:MAG: branched-chain amino acid transport system II carrier protein [Oscillospiraceae bacterium]|nr:branched-chain amino acid transport system II carrier protein [Oscillospiraceae bacterium]
MIRRLNLPQRLLVGVTLFGMFFGANGLFFPVHLGQLAGRNLIPAILGFVITAVGIPLLGVAAIGMTHSDGLQALAGKVGKGYSRAFTCLLYLMIGPFFVIPRYAAFAYTTDVAPLLKTEASAFWSVLLFSAAFFALVLVFSLRPAGIILWIGKIITPLFLLFLTVLVVFALANSETSAFSVAPAAAYQNGAFFSALIEGYGTMDGMAGLAFGIMIIEMIRALGVKKDPDVAREVLISSLFTGLIMVIIYVAIIIMGAQSRGVFARSENGVVALTQISAHHLGTAGSMILAVIVTLACLKTSIVLVTSCANAFVRMFPKAFGYRVWAILITAVSFVISNFGLDHITACSLPVLMFLYPPAITLILLALSGKLFDHDRAVYVSVTAFTCAAALFDLIKTLPASVRTGLHLDGLVAVAEKYLPLFDQNLGWTVPALIGLCLGLAIRRFRSKARR